MLTRVITPITCDHITYTEIRIQGILIATLLITHRDQLYEKFTKGE